MTKLQPGIPSYIIRLTYKFSGHLNRKIFEESLNILFQRHNILFSVIRETNNEPYCDILLADVFLRYFDFTELNAEEKHQKVAEILADDSKKPFDLEKGPLYRMYLIQNTVEEYFFRLSLHHIIFDGWSQGILINDLGSIYNSLLSGNEVKLEPLEFQQYDFAHWETETTEKDESVAFWKENLNGCSPVLNFPYDFSRKEQSTARGAVEPFQISRDLSEKLRQISREEKSSLFTTMMAGFGVLMNKYSAEDDLNIGLPVAYRHH